MINNPHPFEGLNIGIPVITPIKGRRFSIRGLHYGRQLISQDPPCTLTLGLRV